MNALTKFQSGTIQLSEAEQLILAEMQEDTNAFDMQPAKVKIAPGGIGQFMLGDEAVKTFTAVVAISQKVRGYWPESGTGQPPICSSPNGSIGFFDPNIPDDRFRAATTARHPHLAILQMTNNQPLQDSYDCFSCPMNQWGSEHQRRNGAGKGKGCKEMRRLLLLINDWALPALMALPPTSIRAWDEYCSALQAKRGTYWAVKTKFSLDSAKAQGGETYNIVQVSVDSPIKDVESLKLVAEIRKQYRELVVTMPITADDYDAAPTDGNGASPTPTDDGAIEFDESGRPLPPF